MALLRTSYRLTGRDVDPDAIGGGINNYLQGSTGFFAEGRVGRYFGGFVMGSINALNSIFTVAADSALASFYGVTFVSNVLTSGFRIYPVVAYARDQGSIAHILHPTASLTGSTFALFPLGLTIGGATTSTYTVSYTNGKSISVNAVWYGWIISVPDQLR